MASSPDELDFALEASEPLSPKDWLRAIRAAWLAVATDAITALKSNPLEVARERAGQIQQLQKMIKYVSDWQTSQIGEADHQPNQTWRFTFSHAAGPDDVTLWRYMTFDRFKWMLSINNF